MIVCIHSLVMLKHYDQLDASLKRLGTLLEICKVMSSIKCINSRLSYTFLEAISSTYGRTSRPATL